MSWSKLGDLLLEANLIDEVQMRIALEEQRRLGTKFGSTLIALHFIDEDVLTAFLSKQLDMPCVSLANAEIPPAVLARLPRELALRLEVIPVRVEGDKLHVAVSDPIDMDILEAVEQYTGMAAVPMVAPQSSIQHALKRLYPDPEGPMKEARNATPGLFPELLKEINELEVFAPYFKEIHQRLDRIDSELAQIKAILSQPKD